MLKTALGAARGLNPGLALAFIVIAAAALYAVAYLDPYVGLVMAPFFALGCARGKHPAILLALSLVPAVILLAVSWIKFSLTGIPLVTYDHHFLRQNVVMLVFNDWRIAAAVVVTTGATLLYIKHLFAGRGAFSRFEKWSLAALTAASVAGLVGLQRWDQSINNWEDVLATPSLRTFVASARMPRPELRIVAEAKAASPVMAPAGLTAPGGTAPDIFFVLQESTFPPSMAPTEFEPHTLFARSGADSGPLRVPTFAGATWKTEFAVTTQMRPQEFGADGLYVFYQLEGRIKQSLFTRLKALGYRTMVFYPVPGSFVNARNFYSSIGVDEFYDPESLGIGRGWGWEIPDAKLYDAMLKKIADSPMPVAAMMLTINQHGPHDNHDPLTDYVARFAQSDDAYRSFLVALGERPRPAGVVTFGDHMPEFMARFERDQALYVTAYEVRCVNFTCAGAAIPEQATKALDAVLLAPFALEKFGFKLDSFSKLERSLYRDCGDDASRCSDAARLGVNAAFARFFE